MAELFHVSIDYLTGYAPDNGRGGLTAEEYDALVQRALEEENLRKIQNEERNLSNDLSEDEIREIELDEQIQRWQEAGEGSFFELFQIKELFEYLNQEQRERVLNVVNAMFPNAAKGLYTDEIPRK